MAEVSARIAHAREPRRPPLALSAGEMVRFLDAPPSMTARAALATAHAARLRVSEVIGLRLGKSTLSASSAFASRSRRPFLD